MIQINTALAQLASTPDIVSIRKTLQAALELEHATLPPYLFALYSIVPGSNVEASAILRSVVMQEMLHVALCCNLLNAVGGAPVLHDASFIPAFPGALPGGVADGLQVGLAPLSVAVVRDVFMKIEEPENPLQLLGVSPGPITIGQFYQRIRERLTELDATGKLFVGDPALQVTAGLQGLAAVTDLASAQRAIDLIVLQGEGNPSSPLDGGGVPAHYYRFEQIVRGRALVPAAGDPPFAYNGAPVLLDLAGIRPTLSNPTQEALRNTPAAALDDAFNDDYTELLRLLHDAFNGKPASLGIAIGVMYQVRTKALELMATEIAPGVTAGPTFSYRPGH